MSGGLRIVSFNVYPPAYALVAGWAKAHRHQVVLLVTSPSPKGERYGQGHRELIAALPPEQDALVTTRLRRTAAPAIAAIKPDLIICASFPHRIPPEITAIPRYGAVNYHPAPLPRGRGPNPQRLIYEGEMAAYGTLHRIVPELDAGPILSQRRRELAPDLAGNDILDAWVELMVETLHEGVERAVSGEPGEAQADHLATYAAPFTMEETVLHWDEPARTIQRKAAALNLVGTVAQASIDGQTVAISDVRAHGDRTPAAPPGTILARHGDHVLLRAADGAVAVTTRAA
jgi:methionyl-tRNA formyltransferase